MWRAGSFGSSGSQMIAVCFARFARCRSMQFAETFKVPSSYHLMKRLSGFHETFFTFVNGLIQSMRLACSRQKPSGSFTERAYISSYFARSMKARSRHSFETGTSVSDMSSSQCVFLDIGGRSGVLQARTLLVCFVVFVVDHKHH